jgi:hypothetical protein
MFNLFKKKSEIEILELKFKRITEEAYQLSKINRTKSDAKYAEADQVMEEIQRIQKKDVNE